MGSLATCERLLRHHANINSRNKHGETPVITACALGRIEILELLIHHGAKLDIFDHNHRSPIFITVLRQHWDMAALILLNLKNFASFNLFSYQLLVNYLSFVVKSAEELLASLPQAKRQEAWLSTKQRQNTLGMILKKKPANDFCRLFKIKVKNPKNYLQRLEKAAELHESAPPQCTFVRI